MTTTSLKRALGLGVTAALVSSAFPLTSASAAPTPTVEVRSSDGSAFSPSDYAAGDTTRFDGPHGFARWLDAMAAHGASTNVGSFVGASTVREYAKGLDATPATPAELDTMRAAVGRAMADGAFGVGTTNVPETAWYVPCAARRGSASARRGTQKRDEGETYGARGERCTGPVARVLGCVGTV